MKLLKLLQKMPRSTCGLAALLVTPLAMAQLHDDYCGEPLPRGFDMPPNQAHTGRYLNRTYGYSVDVPAGLVAFTSASGPERGFLIALAPTSQAFLRVDASYDVFYDITADGVHRRDVGAIRFHHTLLEDRPAQFTLAQVAGGRYRMRFKCRNANEPALHEEVIALRNREIYRLDLQTTPDRYDADLPRLDGMLKSWRWEALR